MYFSILYARYRAGVVTRDMLALPKSRFVAIGLLEALGVASGMSAGGSFLHTPQDGVNDRGSLADLIVFPGRSKIDDKKKLHFLQNIQCSV